MEGIVQLIPTMKSIGADKQENKACCNYIIHIENGMIKELYQVSKENEPKLRNFFEV